MQRNEQYAKKYAKKYAKHMRNICETYANKYAQYANKYANKYANEYAKYSIRACRQPESRRDGATDCYANRNECRSGGSVIKTINSLKRTKRMYIFKVLS